MIVRNHTATITMPSGLVELGVPAAFAHGDTVVSDDAIKAMREHPGCRAYLDHGVFEIVLADDSSSPTDLPREPTQPVIAAHSDDSKAEKRKR